MVNSILPDKLWDAVRPLLPRKSVRINPGPIPPSDEACLTGILFMLHTGVDWEYLPASIGCVSGRACWARLREWERAGVWQDIYRVVTKYLANGNRIDWSQVTSELTGIRPHHRPDQRQRQ